MRDLPSVSPDPPSKYSYYWRHRSYRFEFYQSHVVVDFLLAVEKAEWSASPLPDLPRALFPDLIASGFSMAEEKLLVICIAVIYCKANLSLDILVPPHHAYTSLDYFDSDYFQYDNEVRVLPIQFRVILA